MSLVGAASGSVWEPYLPQWFVSIPKKETLDQKINGDWCRVTLIKRDEKGEVISKRGFPTKFEFTQEVSTGDLYLIQQKNGDRIDHLFQIAWKAAGLFLLTPLYMVGIMGGYLAKIVVDVTSIFWRVIPQLIADFKVKGVISALGNCCIAVVWRIPSDSAIDIWRVVRSPIYAVGYMISCLYAVINPLEGRKWMSDVEYEWHERSSYQLDIRHGRSEEKVNNMNLSERLSDCNAGKVCFLGNCMQKRGNIHETRAGKPRFEFFSNKTQEI